MGKGKILENCELLMMAQPQQHLLSVILALYTTMFIRRLFIQVDAVITLLTCSLVQHA